MYVQFTILHFLSGSSCYCSFSTLIALCKTRHRDVDLMTRHWRRESRRQQFDSRLHLGQAANVVIAKNDEERVYAAHRSAYHLNQPRTRRIRLDRFGETLDFRVIALSVSEYCVLEWSPASRGARGDRGVMQERMHRKLLKEKKIKRHLIYILFIAVGAGW